MDSRLNPIELPLVLRMDGLQACRATGDSPSVGLKHSEARHRTNHCLNTRVGVVFFVQVCVSVQPHID